MDIELEMSLLKKRIAKSAHPDHIDMRKWLSEPKSSEQKIYSATLDYGATGEGTTLAMIIGYAFGEGDFLRTCVDKLGGYYFVIGVKVHEGLPPLDDHVAKALLTPAIRASAEREIVRSRCSYSYFAEHHINCS